MDALGSLVWGAEMASIGKLRDGQDRAPLLGSCCSIGQCNNRPNNDVSGGGGVEEEI